MKINPTTKEILELALAEARGLRLDAETKHANAAKALDVAARELQAVDDQIAAICETLGVGKDEALASKAVRREV